MFSRYLLVRILVNFVAVFFVVWLLPGLNVINPLFGSVFLDIAGGKPAAGAAQYICETGTASPDRPSHHHHAGRVRHLDRRLRAAPAHPRAPQSLASAEHFHGDSRGHPDRSAHRVSGSHLRTGQTDCRRQRVWPHLLAHHQQIADAPPQLVHREPALSTDLHHCVSLPGRYSGQPDAVLSPAPSDAALDLSGNQTNR